MHRLLHDFIPHRHNNHRPYLTRHPGLATILVFALSVQMTLNTFFSSSPQILGFATNIYQQELIELTNQKRIENSLVTLQHSPTLDEAARLKAIHMFDKNYWAHVSPDGVEPWHWFGVAGYSYISAGENLARDFDTSSGVVTAWMASPTHRENLLYPQFQEIGMAVVNGVLDGRETTLVVQLFGTPTPSPSLALETQPQEETVTVAGAETGLPAQAGPPTATPLPTPISTLAPTDVTATPELVLVEEPTATIIPTITFVPTPTDSVALGPSRRTVEPSSDLQVALSVFSNWRSFSISRLFMLSLTSGLMGLFLLDVAVLAQRRIKRENAHHLVHVGVLLIILIGTLVNANGAIL